MEGIENEKLHSFTVDLSKKATEIKNQISTQSLMLESIQYQSNKNQESFQQNKDIFTAALIMLDKDKRNIVIMGLVLTIFLLIYILKH